LQFDLGDRDAAEASRDAALQLGREGGHEEIMAWSFELLAWFALVDGKYRDTIDFAEAGLAIAPHTSAGVQLTVQGAKASARIGDRRAAELAMRQAATTLARLPAPSHPEHQFVFDPSKLSFYARAPAFSRNVRSCVAARPPGGSRRQQRRARRCP
jgi:hypothetical protein